MEEKNEQEVEEKVEETEESTEETKEESTEESTDLKAKVKELEAEKKELDGKYRRVKTKLDKVKETTGDKPESKEDVNKSDEPDYAKLAFLEGKGVKHPDDQKIVQDEAKRLNLPLTDVLEMKHIVGQLKDSNDQREAEDGTKGLGKGTGKGGSQRDVDYYIAKGEIPKDPELHAKVIEAKMAQDDSRKMFDESLD